MSNIDEAEVKEPEVREYSFDEVNHIHTYIGKPLMGTSTIVNVLAKPLTWWASGLAVSHLGWTNSKLRIGGKYKTVPLEERIAVALPRLEEIRGMDVEEFIALLDDAYKAHSVKLTDSASAGTDLHAECEAYVKWRMGRGAERQWADRIIPFIRWAEEEVEEFLWSELHCYSSELWVGGITDCGVKLKNGKIGVLDFKSSKEAYISQFIQCAGYDLQLAENGGFNAQGYPMFKLEKPIEFYGIIPFGAEEFKVDIRYNVEELREGFKGAVVLYKLTNQ